MKSFLHITGCFSPLLAMACLLGLGFDALPGPDSTAVTITLPHLTVPARLAGLPVAGTARAGQADTDTVVVPVGLRNEWDEIGGLQLDISIGDIGPSAGSGQGLTLDTILTTERTAGWSVDLQRLPAAGVFRILLFDPTGKNVAAGAGPIMELVLSIPEEVVLPDYIPLRVAAVVVSDPVGEALPAGSNDGSLTLGETVELKVGEAEADQGETVRLAVSMSNSGPVNGIQFILEWDANLLTLEGVSTTDRTTRFQLEWQPSPAKASGPVPRELRGAGGWVWLYAQAGNEMEPGTGDILELTFNVSTGVYLSDSDIRLLDARVMVSGGREQAVTRIIPGRVRVFPGYLDPPRNLVALSGQEGRVSLSWAPPTGQSQPLTGYSIYRGREIPVLRHLDTEVDAVGPAVTSFVDTSAANGQRYTYAITARYEEQFESGPSNEVEATPSSWVDFTVGEITVMAGGQAAIPILIDNDDPVSGIRFEVRDVPSGHLSNPRVVLGKHAPPDWVVSLERDTVSGVLSVVGFSPRLTAIPPGKGAVLLLLLDAEAVIPARVQLEAGGVVISDAHGDAYQVRVSSGSVFIDVHLAWLRVGTGAPTQPGDTGYVSIFMDNPHPVVAFQLVIRSASNALQVVDVQRGSRLPADAHVALSDLGDGAVRLIESSFSGTPIAAGRGPVVTIAYRVDHNASEGLVELNLENVVLSDERGLTLRQTTVSGSFPIGEVRAVFAPAASEGEPGHTVTVPLGLANSIDLCGFQMTLDYDSRYLAFLSFEALERIPCPDGLTVEPVYPSGEKPWPAGRIRLHYAPGDSRAIQAGTGPLLNLIFLLDDRAPGDTSLAISPSRVTARGCEERLVFTMGQEGEVTIGKPIPEPAHFLVEVKPTGITHFIKVRAATLGGVYLNADDELAAIDSAGWVSSEGEVGQLMVGTGVVQPDGSVNITAVMGFSRRGPFGEAGPGSTPGGTYLDVLPGARTGGTIHFQAWDGSTDREGRISADARYILGAGVWGENNGLTVIELVRIPEQARPAPELFPEQLEVAPNEPNPFSDTTTIRFGLPEEMEVKVTVFDLMGREMATLHDGITAAGYHEVVWNGTNASGKAARNGMYFYQVRTPGGTLTNKLLLMR